MPGPKRRKASDVKDGKTGHGQESHGGTRQIGHGPRNGTSVPLRLKKDMTDASPTRESSFRHTMPRRSKQTRFAEGSSAASPLL